MTSKSDEKYNPKTMISPSSSSSEIAIEAERSKSILLYREAISPGLFYEMKLKRVLASTESKYQKIDVYDTHFGKTLVTDGKTQSSQFDEFAFHESLVHPAMLKFASCAGVAPRKVFIGGGGELATAREVLRYPGVEKVIMVDLDAAVVDICKAHLPEWGGEKVLSDSRMQLIVGDALQYMNETSEVFDVIIMDISDPIEAGPGIMLYTKEFYEHAITRLSSNGVFVTQSGMAEAIPTALIPDLEADPSCFAPIYNTLSAVFDCVVPYSCDIPCYGSDWGFNMAFQCQDKSQAARLVEEWKVPPNRDLIDELITKHVDGGHGALRLYDGTTHMSLFALTKPLRQQMAEDSRVMTRDNPIFMF